MKKLWFGCILWNWLLEWCVEGEASVRQAATEGQWFCLKGLTIVVPLTIGKELFLFFLLMKTAGQAAGNMAGRLEFCVSTALYFYRPWQVLQISFPFRGKWKSQHCMRFGFVFKLNMHIKLSGQHCSGQRVLCSASLQLQASPSHICSETSISGMAGWRAALWNDFCLPILHKALSRF